jgi:quinolinate synthase
MAMNGLRGVLAALQNQAPQIHVDPTLIPRARQPIDKMPAFTAARKNAQLATGIVPNIGAA